MGFSHVRAFDATVRARRSGPVAPLSLRLPAVEPVYHRSPEPRPARPDFSAWLALRGLAESFRSATKAERQELCRRYTCERRGVLFQTAAERAGELPITTTATVA